MSTSNTLTKTDLTNILNEIVAIDGTDMTSQEIEDFVDSLDTTAVHAVDYVVEQGTDNDWEYRKWNSGKYDAFYNKTHSSARNTAWGNWYRSAEQTVNLPSFDQGGYAISGSVNGAEILCFLTFGTGYIAFYIVRPTSTATVDSRGVKMILHGRWK